MTVLLWHFKHAAGAGRTLFIASCCTITDVKVAIAMTIVT